MGSAVCLTAQGFQARPVARVPPTPGSYGHRKRAVIPGRIMVQNVIQCNLNHSWNALDLFKQHLIELHTDICVVSEPPPRMNASADWYTSLNGSAAIFISVPYPRRLVGRSRSTVTIIIEEVYIISCYVSPNIVLYFYRTLSNLCSLQRCPVARAGPCHRSLRLLGGGEPAGGVPSR